MKTLMRFIRKGNRNQSLALITIGVAMFVGSNLAEQAIGERTAREVVQLSVILFGIAAAAILFRRKNANTHRDREE